MNEVINEAIKGINGKKIIRMDRSQYRPLPYFQVNSHSKILGQLFRSSALLTQLREMLFLSLQQIYLRSYSILNVLSWIQPPINSHNPQKRDQKYMKAIQCAQQQGKVGAVSERIYIIEIERLLRVIQYDNKEITLKLLFELSSHMHCHIQMGRQEYIFYDKFFAYLHHQFTTQLDYVYLSEQQRMFLRKQREEISLNKTNDTGIKKIGQLSDCQGSYLSEDFYDSCLNIQIAKPSEFQQYQFLGFQINDQFINAIYGDLNSSQKLFLRPVQLFNQNQLKAQNFSIASPRNDVKIQTESVAEIDEYEKIEYEVDLNQEVEFEGGLELNLSRINQNATVLFQVFSCNSECVAGIKFWFPNDNASFPLIQFPCIEPQEGGYDCHSFTFKPLSKLKGFQIQKLQIENNLRLVKNFVLLLDKDLEEYSFDFHKNQPMEEVANLHDQIIPLFNDDFRKAKFTIYANFSYQVIAPEKHHIVIDKLKKIFLAISSLFPEVDYVENKKQLIKPYLFEMYAIGVGRKQHRDNYDRQVFLQLENWNKILEFENVLENLIDGILIFIWSCGGPEGLNRMQKQIR